MITLESFLSEIVNVWKSSGAEKPVGWELLKSSNNRFLHTYDRLVRDLRLLKNQATTVVQKNVQIVS